MVKFCRSAGVYGFVPYLALNTLSALGRGIHRNSQVQECRERMHNHYDSGRVSLRRRRDEPNNKPCINKLLTDYRAEVASGGYNFWGSGICSSLGSVFLLGTFLSLGMSSLGGGFAFAVAYNLAARIPVAIEGCFIRSHLVHLQDMEMAYNVFFLVRDLRQELSDCSDSEYAPSAPVLHNEG